MGRGLVHEESYFRPTTLTYIMCVFLLTDTSTEKRKPDTVEKTTSPKKARVEEPAPEAEAAKTAA